MMRLSQKRIVDANFNRLIEGLRVCEDILRFVTNHTQLTRIFKNFRHELSGVKQELESNLGALALFRSPDKDVGFKNSDSESFRRDFLDLLRANLSRAKESARVLEEILKLINISASKKIKALRFDIYQIEKKIESNQSLLKKLNSKHSLKEGSFMKKNNLVVVGSVAYDSIKTHAGEKNRVYGGSAVHFSLSSSLFTKTGVIGVVGIDFRERFYNFLKKYHIDVRGIKKDMSVKTFAWKGVYRSGKEDPETIFTKLNALASFKPELAKPYQSAKYIFLANIDPDQQLRVIKRAKKGSIIGLDTMNFWIETKKKNLLTVLRRVDFVFINESEIKLLTGKKSIESAYQNLRSVVKGWIICKRGKNGVVAYKGAKKIVLPGYTISNVIDPTGAGDSFAGAFMGTLATSATKLPTAELVKEAAINGNIVGSFAVQGFGATWRAKLTPRTFNQRKDAYIKLSS